MHETSLILPARGQPTELQAIVRSTRYRDYHLPMPNVHVDSSIWNEKRMLKKLYSSLPGR